MLTVFAGKDDFESEAAARSAAASLPQVQVIQAGNIDLASFEAELGGGLFANQASILLLNPSDNQQIWNYLQSKPAKIYNKQVLVWHNKELLKPELVNLQKIEAKIEQFEPITLDYTGAKMVSWLINHSKQLGLKISVAQAQTIYKLLGNNKRFLHNQVLQLLNSPNLADSIANLQPMYYPDYTGLLDALLAGDTKLCIDLLQSADSQDEVHAVIGLITWQLEQLLIYFVQGAKQLTKSQQFKLSKYGHNFTFAKVQRLVASLYNIDLSIRKGASNPVNALILYSLLWKQL